MRGTLPAGGAASGAGSESSGPEMMCRRLMNDTPFPSFVSAASSNAGIA